MGGIELIIGRVDKQSIPLREWDRVEFMLPGSE